MTKYIVSIIWLHVLASLLGLSQMTDAHQLPKTPLSPQVLDILTDRGFIGEMYTTKSRDGITPLSLYHIVNPLADQMTLNRYPVVMFHGLMGDAAQMISLSSEVQARKPILNQINVAQSDTSLALMLSNNNFDVWLIDARGTNLNNHNINDELNFTRAQKYWDYSLDEQSLYDLPAMIDFVLEQTHSERVVYVGFSQSTFFMFALLSTEPQYETKLAAFVAMAPVAYVAKVRGLAIPSLTPYLLVPFDVQGASFPQPLIDIVSNIAGQFCRLRRFSNSICHTIAQTGAGIGNADTATRFFDNLVKGTSIKSLRHFLQLFLKQRFAMYDYGSQVNLIKYRQLNSPNYELSKIKLPTIILVRGGNDFLSNPDDQRTLINQLGTKPYMDIFLPTYNHLDFILARNIVADINGPVSSALYNILVSEGSLVRDLNKLPPMKRPHEPISVTQTPNRDASTLNGQQRSGFSYLVHERDIKDDKLGSNLFPFVNELTKPFEDFVTEISKRMPVTKIIHW